MIPPTVAATGYRKPGRRREDLVRVDVVRLPRWSGVPVARNAGAAVAQAPILFITDANVIFPRDGIFPFASESPPIVFSAQRLLTWILLSAAMAAHCSFHPWVSTGSAIPVNTAATFPVSPCSGTAIAAGLFHRAGGYDTEMPVYGAAEPEFSVRLWLCGAEIVSMPDLVLQHRFRPSSERQPFLDAIGKVSSVQLSALWTCFISISNESRSCCTITLNNRRRTLPKPSVPSRRRRMAAPAAARGTIARPLSVLCRALRHPRCVRPVGSQLRTPPVSRQLGQQQAIYRSLATGILG